MDDLVEHLNSTLVGLITAAIVGFVILILGMSPLANIGFTFVAAIVGLLGVRVYRKRAQGRAADPAAVIAALRACLDEGELIETAALGRAVGDATVNLRLVDWRRNFRQALRPYPNYLREVERAGSGPTASPSKIAAQTRALASVIEALCNKHGDPDGLPQ